MKKAVRLSGLVVALAWLPCETFAQETGGQGWSVLTGKTVGTNDNAVHIQAGWPGISAALIHGMTPTVDLGGIFSFNYGFEGDVNSVHAGLKLQGLLRATLMETPKYNLGITFAPGPLVYFFGGGGQCYLGYCYGGGPGTVFGIAFPVGLVFGLPASSAVNVAFNFDLPFFVTFGDFGSFVVPILFGGGVEYFLERNMALTFNLRMGPIIFTKSGYGTDFDLQALFGVAIKI